MNPLRTHILLGASLWVISAQYIAAEALTQSVWSVVSYSMRYNTISDLGATMCSTSPMGMYACSPLHALINTAFNVSGVLIALGMVLVRTVFPKSKLISIAAVFITLGAFGTIGAGVFPQNEAPILHVLSAGLLFSFTNLGMLLLGIGLYKSRWHMRYASYTTLSGLVGLVAMCMLPVGMLTSVGVGLVERFAAYPLTLWVIVSGVFLMLLLRKNNSTS